jgi:SSS family solute:Na+ symporter
LLLAGLFAATMSTIESGINSLAALVACDWLPGRQREVRQSRMTSALFGLGVIGAALLMPYLGKNVFDVIIAISGALLGPLLGLFLLGMLVPRANTFGALLGLAAGMEALVSILATDISGWWYGAVTFVPTFVVGVLASLLSPPPPAGKLRGLLVVPWTDPEKP